MLVWYWVTLSPFSEIVTNGQHKRFLPRGFWQWAKIVDRGSFHVSSHLILLWRGTTFPSRGILSTHRNGTWRPVPLWPQGLRSSTLRQHIFPQWFLLSPASFQRLITLRSESTSCCFLKKLEVRVGSNLTVTQRSPSNRSFASCSGFGHAPQSEHPHQQEALVPVTSNPYTTKNGHHRVDGKVHQHCEGGFWTLVFACLWKAQ